MKGDKEVLCFLFSDRKGKRNDGLERLGIGHSPVLFSILTTTPTLSPLILLSFTPIPISTTEDKFGCKGRKGVVKYLQELEMQNIRHGWSAESMTEKARWFQTLPVPERLDMLAFLTDMALDLNPELKEFKNAESTTGRVLVLTPA